MSEFVSWVKCKDEIFFLKNSDLDTEEGRRVYPKIKDDICGHGAIKEYYYELKGKPCIEEECTDFSKPSNFPKEISEAIKKGQMSRIGICLDVLNEVGKKKYEKIQQSAWAEYEKIEQLALAEYEKIRQSDLAEYEKIQQSAWAEYEKIQQPAWAEYEKIRQSALAEYEKIQQSALAEYEKIRQSDLAEYKKIRQSAWAEYEKIRQSAFSKIVSQKKYRNKEWK